jgi:acetyl esterase
MPVDRHVRKVLDQYAALGAQPRTALSPEEARRQPTVLDAVNAVRQQRGDDLTPEAVGDVHDQIIQGADGEIPARIYRPALSGPLPMLVYFHSGGWVTGSLGSCDATCRALANLAQCLVISVAYRLAPEHPFPAAVQDAYAAVQWAIAMASALGGDETHVAVAGESAGGNLATVVALMARDSNSPMPVYQVLIYPIVNYAFDTPSYEEHANAPFLSRDEMRWFWRHYLPDEASGATPYASPLRAEDLSGLPAALIITAEYDPLRDEGEAYARRLQEARVPVVMNRYDGMVHGFLTMAPVVEQARIALLEIAAQLRSAFTRPPELVMAEQPLPVIVDVPTVEVQEGLHMAAMGETLASPSPGTGDRLVGKAPMHEDVSRSEQPAMMASDTPAQESAPIIPDHTPAAEPEPIIPDHTPAREAEPVIPDQTPAREAEPVIPDHTPAREAEPIIPDHTPAREAEPVIPDQTPAEEGEPVSSASAEREAAEERTSGVPAEMTQEEPEPLVSEEMLVEEEVVVVSAAPVEEREAGGLTAVPEEEPVEGMPGDMAEEEPAPGTPAETTATAGAVAMPEGTAAAASEAEMPASAARETAAPLAPGAAMSAGTSGAAEEPAIAPQAPLEMGQLVRVGMRVVGSDGHQLGKVKQVRGSDFVVDRWFRRDITVPFEAVHEAGAQVILSVPAKEAAKEEWSHPSA